MKELNKFDWSEMKVTPIQGNDYYMVHERVLEFHRRYPDGVIQTEVVEISNDRFITTSKVFPYPNEFPNMFCSGTACEMIGKNKGFSGSELECCETSSVGRALGFLCIGIKHSIASADEVRNAMKKGKSSNINLNDLKEGNPKAKENAKKLEKRKAEQEALMPALKNARGALTGPKGVTVDPAEMERRRSALEAQKAKIAQATAVAVDAKTIQDNKKIVQITHVNTDMISKSSAGILGRRGVSDIRLKEDIELIAKSPSGINIYSFKYKGEKEKYQGVMAQEVLWASTPDEKGYYSVDYSKLDVDFKRLN